jgi:threonyl-tRNA synthetase
MTLLSPCHATCRDPRELVIDQPHQERSSIVLHHAAAIAVMRSSRALRLLQSSARVSHGIYRGTRNHQIIRNGYCSACEAATAKPGTESKATATKNPRTPPADHRQLAIEQELFTTSIYSPGSPLFLPNGTKIFNKLTNFLRTQYDHFGFLEVITPTIYKKSLWEKSGHWENYADDMYSVTGRGASGEKDGRQIGEDEEYGLKPMNCPGHCLIFASKQRSYRDLPIRFADFSPLHRNEIHGALSGLTRVRRFHQDDGHIFCRPSQIREEISRTLDFVKLTYGILGLGPYRLTLSTRPADHYIGATEEWDNAEAALKESLDASGQAWTVNEGDGAFYGPKIDIILKDSDGKEHQTATIQLDFQLPQRFELEYQAPAPELEKKGLSTEDPALLDVQGPVIPVLIHRAVLGSVERIMALLIEHYNGHWPFWLNPRQLIILTVNDSKPVVDFAKDVKKKFQRFHKRDAMEPRDGDFNPVVVGTGNGLSIDIDDSPRSLKKKISEAKRKRYAVIAVVGAKDVEKNRLICDFSGIPDPHNRLVQNMQLRNGRTHRDTKQKTSEGDIESSGEIPKKAEAPMLDPQDLKSYPVQAEYLRNFLNSLQRVYF